ncbi:hypothetical protein KVT40_003476 [Elsinoe batatas]|uniref:Uncharacterized protein n=1 Tax=Elsinoe batatas TaxID=2601811 RepID=A0A8K0PH34_9PEZI|nr:hypothetical protein KVT40_003476 [Elsinoe batatas]
MASDAEMDDNVSVRGETSINSHESSTSADENKMQRADELRSAIFDFFADMNTQGFEPTEVSEEIKAIVSNGIDDYSGKVHVAVEIYYQTQIDNWEDTIKRYRLEKPPRVEAKLVKLRRELATHQIKMVNHAERLERMRKAEDEDDKRWLAEMKAFRAAAKARGETSASYGVSASKVYATTATGEETAQRLTAREEVSFLLGSVFGTTGGHK